MERTRRAQVTRMLEDAKRMALDTKLPEAAYVVGNYEVGYTETDKMYFVLDRTTREIRMDTKVQRIAKIATRLINEKPEGKL